MTRTETRNKGAGFFQKFPFFQVSSENEKIIAHSYEQPLIYSNQHRSQTNTLLETPQEGTFNNTPYHQSVTPRSVLTPRYIFSNYEETNKGYQTTRHVNRVSKPTSWKIKYDGFPVARKRKPKPNPKRKSKKIIKV